MFWCQNFESFKITSFGSLAAHLIQPNVESMADYNIFFFYPQEAISSHPTDSKKGVSRVSIKKYVYTCRIKLSMLTIFARYLEDKYKLDMSAASNTSNLNGAIKRAVEKNELALPGGPSGRVKLVAVSFSSYPAFLSVLKTVLFRRPPSPRPLRRSPPLRRLLPLSPLRRRLPPRPLPRRLFLPLRRLPLLSLLLPRPRLLFLRRRLRLRALLSRRLLKRRLLLRRRPKLLLVS